MDMKIVVLVLLGVLILMSFVQGIQINSLEEKLEENNVLPQQTNSASAKVNIPITGNVPAMVGGC